MFRSAAETRREPIASAISGLQDLARASAARSAPSADRSPSRRPASIRSTRRSRQRVRLAGDSPAGSRLRLLPLPAYNSLKSYRAVKKQLHNELARAIARRTIVQCDYGGYPFSLGQFTWPIAGKAGKKRIWIFDGGDPFPQWRFAANQDKNIVKRQAKLWVIRRFESFLNGAIPEADLVFAHNNSVVTRFKSVWGPHCHQFDRSFVTDDLLLTNDEIAQRQRNAAATQRTAADGRRGSPDRDQGDRSRASRDETRDRSRCEAAIRSAGRRRRPSAIQSRSRRSWA